ncbi:hypothetical protein ACLBWX_15650 [Methylobacterium sp. M6A4_1b]
MDTTRRSPPAGTHAAARRDPAVRRSQARRARSHFLVACLAGGLQATYAPELEADVSDVFAGLIARLEAGEPGGS